MYRSGKHLKILTTLMFVGLCLGFAEPAWANLRFFSIVQQTCKSYRIPVTAQQMDLQETAEGVNDFTIALESRRNNFEEVMLVGYIAVGNAIARTGLNVQTINITVTIPSADNMLLMTTANASLVEQLRLGEVKSSDFMRQLQWN